MVADDGAPIANAEVRVMDMTRLSGFVDRGGCGTHYPEVSATTDADGRFSVTAPFAPSHVLVSVNDPWARPSQEPQRVGSGDLTVTVPRQPHRAVSGLIEDASGAPVAGASVMALGPLGVGTRSDERGHFAFEVAEPPPAEFRVRRMGFRPQVVALADLPRVVLASPRPLITVTVIDEHTHQPFSDIVKVSAFQGQERLSFCSAGAPSMTHEPAVGACTLDAEPGDLELRLEGGGTTHLVVKAPRTAVTMGFTPPPLPTATDDGR